MNDKPSILQLVFEAAEAGVRGNIKHNIDNPDFQLMSCFIGIDAQGNTVVIGTPFGDEAEKQASLVQVRKLFRQHNVIAYAMVSEAWMSTIVIKDNPDAATQVRAGRWPKMMPSEDPERREVIIVLATDNIETRQQVFDIIRDERGCMKDIELSSEQADEARGRMYNLLGG